MTGVQTCALPSSKGVELQGLVWERDGQAKEKGEVQQAVEELKKQLEAKGVELQGLVCERDAQAKEKGEVQQAVEELRKQQMARAVELQGLDCERDAEAKEKGDVQQAVEELRKQLTVSRSSRERAEIPVVAVCLNTYTGG